MSGENNCDDKQTSFEDRFYGAATVGERGQIVIPVEARKKYGIDTGDKLLIMGAPRGKGLMLVKIDALREFMTSILQDLQRVEQEYHARETPEDDKTERTAS